MPHQRIVKAEFFTDADMGELPPLYRLFYMGLWTQADRKGVLEDKPRQLKARVMPYDDLDAETVISELVGRGKLIRYKVGDKRLLQVASWKKNQAIHANEKDSDLPEASKATEIVALPILDRLDTVSATIADGQLTPLPSPPPPPVPSPPPGPSPMPGRLSPAKSRLVEPEKPDKPREQWGYQDFEAWAQYTRAQAGIAPEAGLPIGESDPVWQAITHWTGGRIQPICDAFIAYGEDPFWQRKTPPLPLRGFLSQWSKYMPVKEVSRAS